MSSNSDYYKILGISKDASEADIKKAYRKAALKYHPDKNTNNKEEAEKKFKMVGEAYQILSNPDERAAYDKYGKAGVNGGGGSAGAGGMRHYTEFSSTEADELFRQFFASGDMADIFSNMGQGGARGMRTGNGPRVVFRSSGFGPGGMAFSFGNAGMRAAGRRSTSSSNENQQNLRIPFRSVLIFASFLYILTDSFSLFILILMMYFCS